MFITNNDRSFIGYKDMLKRTVLLFDSSGNSISNTNIRCSNWQVINLYEVPIVVLEHVSAISK